MLQFTSPFIRAVLFCGFAGLCLLLTACQAPQPRSFADFMEDRIARDGTIAHCNQNLEETLNDIECANARRAAAAIALRQERGRREAFELESERKLEALRYEMIERERIIRETTLAAARAEREAYEAMWRGVSRSPGNQSVDADSGPTDRLSLIELPLELRPISAQ